jgi:predicted TIM-barrel fold metal-dependent hydrolase
MIVDFQHHFTPRELIKEDPGDRLILHYDAMGAPSYTIHSLLYDLDEHVKMMDLSGIDAAWLTSAQGMCADLETSRFVNDKAKKAEKDYPGRFIGAAHANPLGGPEALKELNRCRHELGCEGVVITSEHDGKFLDNPAYEPFWTEAARLGMFVFVHPALKLNYSQQFDAFDTARSVFDRHPNLTIHMAHLSGGMASMLGRIRSYQDKVFWGTKGNERHGAGSKKDFDYYINNNLIFDTAGFAGAITSVKASMVEIPASRIVFATDYPQEIRAREAVRDFVRDIRAMGKDGEAILSGNVGKLLKGK